jgi:hypothetical protein
VGNVKSYRWTLTFEGKTKEYKIGEFREVDGDWVKVGSSSWSTLPAAISHIERTNEQRVQGVSP